MLGNFSLFFWLCFGAASVWRSARGMESARGLWRRGGWADPRKRLRGRPVPRETARRVVRGASTLGGGLVIVSAESGGILVAAAGPLELARIICAPAAHWRDVLGEPCLCIL